MFNYKRFFLIVSIFFLAQISFFFLGQGFWHSYRSLHGILGPFVLPPVGLLDNFDISYIIRNLPFIHTAQPLFLLYQSLVVSYEPDTTKLWTDPTFGKTGFYIFHSILGILILFLLNSIFLRFRIHKIIRTIVISCYAFSPHFNAFQAWATYDFPSIFLVILSIYFLTEFQFTKRKKFLVLFTFCLFILCSIRGLFDVFLFFTPIFLLIFFLFYREKKFFFFGLVIFILLLINPIKNFILFGKFINETFRAENFALKAQNGLTIEQRNEGLKKKYFNELILCPIAADNDAEIEKNYFFSGTNCFNQIYSQYREDYREKIKKNFDFTKIHMLNPLIMNKELKNHRLDPGFIGVTNLINSNSVAAIRYYPLNFFKNTLESGRIFFTPIIAYFHANAGDLSFFKSFSYINITRPYLPFEITKKYFPFFFNKENFWGSNSISFIFLYFFSLLIIWSSLYLNNRLPKLFLLKFTFIWFFLLLIIKKNITFGNYTTFESFFVFSNLIASFFFLFWCFFKFLISIILNKIKNNEKKIVHFYVLMLISYVSYLTILYAYTEHQRYRIYIDGCFIFLFVIFFNNMLRNVKNKKIKYYLNLKKNKDIFFYSILIALIFNIEIIFAYFEKLGLLKY